MQSNLRKVKSFQFHLIQQDAGLSVSSSVIMSFPVIIHMNFETVVDLCSSDNVAWQSIPAFRSIL